MVLRNICPCFLIIQTILKHKTYMIAIPWTTTTAVTADGHFFEKVIANPSFELLLALDPNCPIAAAASLGLASKNPPEGPGTRENSAT